MIDEQVFGALDLGFLPEEVAGYAHYQQGLVDLRVGNERWATTHFSKLPEGEPRGLARQVRHAGHSPAGTPSSDIPQGDGRAVPRAVEGREADPGGAQRRDARGGASALRAAELHGRARRLRAGAAALARPRPRQPVPGGGVDAVPAGPGARGDGPSHHARRALVPRGVPARQVPAPGAHLPRPLPLPARPSARPRSSPASTPTRSRRSASGRTSPKTRGCCAPPSAQRPTKRARRFLESLELEGEQLGRYAGTFGDRMFGYDDEAVRSGPRRGHAGVSSAAARVGARSRPTSSCAPPSRFG